MKKIFIALLCLLLVPLVSATVYYYDTFNGNNSCMGNWHCYAVNQANTSQRIGGDAYWEVESGELAVIQNSSLLGYTVKGYCYLQFPVSMSHNLVSNVTLDYNWVQNDNMYTKSVIPSNVESRSNYLDSTYDDALQHYTDYYTSSYIYNNKGQSVSAGYVYKNNPVRTTINFNLEDDIQNITLVRSRDGAIFTGTFNGSEMYGFRDFVMRIQDYYSSISRFHLSDICLSDTKGECAGLTNPVCPAYNVITNCTEMWEEQSTPVSACFVNNTQIFYETFIDTANCNTTYDLPPDFGENGTTEIGSCDYCAINDCPRPRYTSGDLAPIIGDAIGTAGSAFVANLDLIITLLAILGVVAIAGIVVSKLKR